MGKRSEGTAHTVLDVLGTQLKGQVKQGDSLGLWLFNESLSTGKFPLQKWGAANQEKVATSVVEFLGKQKFEKQAAPDKMMPTLHRVITNSELITVLILSSGDADLHGTPYDNQINASYRQWREQQQKKKMPFVTLLRGEKGVLTHYSVTPAPWPLEVPALPPEPVAQAKPEPPPKKAPPMLPPLIVSGKKPETAPAPKPGEPAATSLAAAPAHGNTGNLGATTSTPNSATNPLTTAASSNTAPAMPGLAATGPSTQKPPETRVPLVAATAGSNATPAETSSKTAAVAPIESAPATPPPDLSQAAVSTKGETSVPGGRSEQARQSRASASMVSPTPGTVSLPNSVRSGFTLDTLLLVVLAVCFGVLLTLLVPRIIRHRTRSTQVSLITRSLDRTAQ